MKKFDTKGPVFRQVDASFGRPILDPKFGIPFAGVEFQFLKDESLVVAIRIFRNQSSLERDPGKVDETFAS